MGVHRLGMVHTVLLGEQAFQAHHFVQKPSHNLWKVVESQIGSFHIAIRLFCKTWRKGLQ